MLLPGSLSSPPHPSIQLTVHPPGTTAAKQASLPPTQYLLT